MADGPNREYNDSSAVGRIDTQGLYEIDMDERWAAVMTPMDHFPRALSQAGGKIQDYCCRPYHRDSKPIRLFRIQGKIHRCREGVDIRRGEERKEKKVESKFSDGDRRFPDLHSPPNVSRGWRKRSHLFAVVKRKEPQNHVSGRPTSLPYLCPEYWPIYPILDRLGFFLPLLPLFYFGLNGRR